MCNRALFCPVLEELALHSIKWSTPSCTRTEAESTILLILAFLFEERKLLFILCSILFSLAVTMFPLELPLQGSFPPGTDSHVQSDPRPPTHNLKKKWKRVLGTVSPVILVMLAGSDRDLMTFQMWVCGRSTHSAGIHENFVSGVSALLHPCCKIVVLLKEKGI